MTNTPQLASAPDVLLIGGGIMSATLGVLLKQLQPDITIEIVEKLAVAAAESSDAWNNAGTGHSAFCELNYTPQAQDGSVDIKKAIGIAETFELSRQFWAYLVEKNLLQAPEHFINAVPHMSFVQGESDVAFLKARHTNMQTCPLFSDMAYSEDPEQLKAWMPLVMEGRDPAQKVAATHMDAGTDVNFGALTRDMLGRLQGVSGVSLFYNQSVKSLRRQKDQRWVATISDHESGSKRTVSAKFVFDGAGGAALPLLMNSGIPESKGFGGFPISGQWLRCTNPDIVRRHQAKVYGKAAVGSPPMSVPHLDTRVIDGQRSLLFGPYAGFTTRFLKKGGILDLPLSIRPSNIWPMLAVARDNIPLTKYLIGQVLQSPQDRLDALKSLFPEAKMEDWKLEIAGQRVQIIKKDAKRGGVLQFGTEVVSAANGSLAALLGASPGASTTLSIMLTLLEKCFPSEMASSAWKAKILEMVPSRGQSLAENETLCREVRSRTARILKLNQPPVPIN